MAQIYISEEEYRNFVELEKEMTSLKLHNCELKLKLQEYKNRYSPDRCAREIKGNNEYMRIKNECDELKEKNKKLKLEYEEMDKSYCGDAKIKWQRIEKLEKENRKLKSEISHLNYELRRTTQEMIEDKVKNVINPIENEERFILLEKVHAEIVEENEELKQRINKLHKFIYHN